MKATANVRGSEIVRLWEIDDEEWYLAEGRRLLLRDNHRVSLKVEKPNLVVSAGMQSVANMMSGNAAGWENLRWYAQALGTSTTTPTTADVGMGFECFRKQYTDFTSSGRVITMNTYFTTSDYANAQTTISNATTPSLSAFSLANVAPSGAFPFAVGDLVQIQCPTQYEYHTIASIVGNLVTLADPCTSGTPVVGATVAQVTDEAGFFGNVPASQTSGTVAVTNGGTTVTGTSTSFSTSTTFVGDWIRFPSSSTPRVWYQVTAINSTTSLTIGQAGTGPTTFQGTTFTGGSYVLRGTMFNHVDGLQYVKLATKGFVFENQWTIGG